jgi:hypothetical protein
MALGGMAWLTQAKHATTLATSCLQHCSHPFKPGLAIASPQVAASLNNSDLAKLAYTHNLDRTASVGAEVSKKVTDSAESPTKFQVGYAKRLQGGGLAKARLDNAGKLLDFEACLAPVGCKLDCGCNSNRMQLHG